MKALIITVLTLAIQVSALAGTLKANYQTAIAQFAPGNAKALLEGIGEALHQVVQSEEVSLYPAFIQEMEELKMQALESLKASRAPEMDPLLDVFNSFEEKISVAKYLFASKVLEQVRQALEDGNSQEALSLLKIYESVGVPDFQKEFMALIDREEDQQLLAGLITALAKTGNNDTAAYLYKKLKDQRKRVFLDGLALSGTPCFVALAKGGSKPNEIIKTLAFILYEGNNTEKTFERLKTRFYAFKTEVEGIMRELQLTPSETEQYRRVLFQSRGEEKDPYDYSYKYKNIELREGDVILTLGGDPTSLFWGNLTSYSSGLGHSVMVTFMDKGFPMLIGMMNKLVYKPIEALGDATSIVVLRYKDRSRENIARITQALHHYKTNRASYIYDFRFDNDSDKSMYCTEFVYHVFNRAKVPVSWVFAKPETESSRNNFAKMGIPDPQVLAAGVYLRLGEFVPVGSAYPNDQGQRLLYKKIIKSFKDSFVSKDYSWDNSKGKALWTVGAKLAQTIDLAGLREFNNYGLQGLVTMMGTIVYIANTMEAKAEKIGLELKDYDEYSVQLDRLFAEVSGPVFQMLFPSGAVAQPTSRNSLQ